VLCAPFRSHSRCLVQTGPDGGGHPRSGLVQATEQWLYYAKGFLQMMYDMGRLAGQKGEEQASNGVVTVCEQKASCQGRALRPEPGHEVCNGLLNCP
jgi:hypothetical protein